MKRMILISLVFLALNILALQFAAAQPASGPGVPAATETAPSVPSPAATPTATPSAPTTIPTPEAAPVAPVVAAEADPIGIIGKLATAIRGGHWREVASLALVLIMILLGRWRDNWPLFRGDRGGAILIGVLALGGATSIALATTAPLDWRLFLGALGAMWTAVGGYNWFKRIVWPKD